MRKKTNFFWEDVSTTGIYVGLALSISVVIAYIMRDSSMLTTVNNIIVLGSLFGISYYRGKRYSNNNLDKPFGYPLAIRYIIISLCFAGIIYGGALYVMYNHIAPEFYQQEVMTMMSKISKDTQSIDEINQTYHSLVSSPIFIIITSVFSMFLMGLFPALIVSALIKRNYVKPTVHHEAREEREGDDDDSDNSNKNDEEE